MTRNALQKIVGKLQFEAGCVRIGHVFVNRLFDAISTLQDGCVYMILEQVRKDLKWWRLNLRKFNGRSIMWMEQKLVVNEVFATDSCLTGAGGLCNGKYFHVQFPEYVFTWDEKVHIAHLELLAIIIGLKIWKKHLKGMRIVVGCDNQAVVTIINTGRSRNRLLQKLLREMCYCLAMAEVEIFARHVKSENNLVPDILSRWGTDVKYEQQFLQLKEKDW